MLTTATLMSLKLLAACFAYFGAIQLFKWQVGGFPKSMFVEIVDILSGLAKAFTAVNIPIAFVLGVSWIVMN